MSSEAKDKFHEDIEKIIDDVKNEMEWVMRTNDDPEMMVNNLDLSFRFATKEVKKIKKQYKL